jgi:thioredoxin-like negative regulator of GroEL
MTPFEIPPKQIDQFVDLFMLGNELNAFDETASLARLVMKLKPEAHRLVAVEAWQLIRASKFPAAREMLEAADAANPREPMLKALLALCLMSQGDSLWQAYLEELRCLPAQDETQTIARVLEEFVQNCPPGANGHQMSVMATLLN